MDSTLLNLSPFWDTSDKDRVFSSGKYALLLYNTVSITSVKGFILLVRDGSRSGQVRKDKHFIFSLRLSAAKFSKAKDSQIVVQRSGCIFNEMLACRVLQLESKCLRIRRTSQLDGLLFPINSIFKIIIIIITFSRPD